MKQKLVSFIRSLAFNALDPNGKRSRGYPLIFLLFYAPLIGFGAVNSYKTHQKLTDLTKSLQLMAIDPAEVVAHTELDKLSDIVLSLSIHPRIQELAENQDWETAQEILGIFKSTTSEDEVERIFLTDSQGTVKSLQPMDQEIINVNFSFREWYQKVVSTGKLSASNIYKRQNAPSKHIFSIAAPVVSKNQQMVGIIVAQINLNAFEKDFSKLNLPSGASVYMVDNNGIMFKEINNGVDTANVLALPYVNKALRGQSGSETSASSYSGAKVLASYTQLLDTGWGLVLERPYDTAFQQRQTILNNQILVYTIFLIFYGSILPIIVAAIYNKT